MKLPLFAVLEQRLKMQSTQKTLELDFKIKDHYKLLNSEYLSNILRQYSEEKRDYLLCVLYGSANLDKALRFFKIKKEKVTI